MKPEETNEYKKINQKVEELTRALQEAAEIGLNVSVIQTSEQWKLPDGSFWPYGPVDLPEIKIQGYGYTYLEKSNLDNLAQQLDGVEYRNEFDVITPEYLKENNLVIVTGRSDDIMFFEGTIRDEFDSLVYLNEIGGIMRNECEPDCPYWEQLEKPYYVKAHWNEEKDKPCWTFETNIPHSVFDVWEDDIHYARAVLFSLDSLK